MWGWSCRSAVNGGAEPLGTILALSPTGDRSISPHCGGDEGAKGTAAMGAPKSSIPSKTSRRVKSAFLPVAEQSWEIGLLFCYETHYSYDKKPPVTLRRLDQPRKEYVSYEEEGLFAIEVIVSQSRVVK